MFRRARWVAVAVVLTLAATAPAEPRAEDISRKVRQLADDDFAVREKASDFLWKAGRPAETALRQALRDGDAETRLRAGRILDRFRWGIFADTPAEVVALIEKYRAGDQAGREAAVKGLLDKGGAGYDALQFVVTAEADGAARQALRKLVADHVGAAVPSLVADERFDALERLLEVAAATREPAAVRDYVAGVMLRGRLDDRIAHYRKLAAQADAAPAEEMLAHLLRAKGDLAGAAAAARRAGNGPPLEAVLYLRRDWAGLADGTGDGPAEARLGLRLSYQRRAGRAEDAARTAADLAAHARAKPEGDGTVWWSAKALFLNDLPDEALAILPHGRHYALMLDILTAQFRYREALALIDTAAANKEYEGRYVLEARRARLLHELGRPEEARKLLDRIAEGVRPDHELWQHYAVVEALVEVGRRDDALKLAARLIAGRKGAEDPFLLSAVFPERAREARAWWQCLRRAQPVTAPADVALAVRDALDGKLRGRGFADLLGRARAAAREGTADEAERLLLSLADTCAALGHAAPARECLADAAACRGSATALLRLADHDADAGRWKEAADGYRKAREKDPASPEAAALEGWALARAGSEAKWTKALERARWLALGDLAKRDRLAEVLEKRGFGAEARRERETLLRLAPAGSWYLGHALDRAADEALARKDYGAAADFVELGMLTVVRSGAIYENDRAYVSEPERVHYYRARGLLGAGKVDEALKEARACLRLLPGDVDVPIALVPALEKLGRRKEADEVFGTMFALYDGLTEVYPGWARGHNRLAWLCARCGRRTDVALAHAKKATALVPDEVLYLGTLAEVHFQRGEKERAVALAKKCVELRPKSDFYRKQLKRYAAGDPKADLPGGGD